MLESIIGYVTQIQIIAPPLLGAFIGYLTNKVAIKMLFRPLKKWHFLGVGIPMTPGVIPSKRHQLAQNIGEMVGSHLLTSREIGKALEKKTFQDHLLGLVRVRVGNIFDRDLAPLPQLVPKKYVTYFDIGRKTISYQVKSNLNRYINSTEFEVLIRKTVDLSLDELLERDIDSFLSRDERERLYLHVDRWIVNMMSSDAMEIWVEDLVFSRINSVMYRGESLKQILPDTITELILQTVEEKTPDLLAKLALILKDPEIQLKIIEAVKKGVDRFVESMGPMGAMVQNFINLETIERVVTDYFKENEDDIEKWLSDKKVQSRVAHSLLERVSHYLESPLVDFFPKNSDADMQQIGKHISRKVIKLLRDDSILGLVNSLVKENIEAYLDTGSKELRCILADASGGNGKGSVQEFISRHGLNLLRSDKAKSTVGDMVDNIIDTFLHKPIGKISNILPSTVRAGLYETIQKISSDMLAAEVPGLVHSLNIKRVVADKIDTLDLLKLEELLLSIMEEQFKYINLFGALLGFLIGCLNVLILMFI